MRACCHWLFLDVWICRVVYACVCLLQHVGAVLWFLQQPSFHDKAEHLLIRKTLVGLLCQSGNLPQYNSKWPTQRDRGRGLKSVSSIINIINRRLFFRSSKHRMKPPCVCLCLWASAHQTSEFVVKTPSFSDSGDIQRTGSKPLPPLR